jgi:dihydrofolate reductase
MRKLIVCNIMSLDGYYEGPGRNVIVLPMDENFDAHNAERLRAAETLLAGRTTFEGWRTTGRASPATPRPGPSCVRSRAATTRSTGS